MPKPETHLNVGLHVIGCPLSFQVVKEQPPNAPVLLTGRDVEVPAGPAGVGVGVGVGVDIIKQPT